MHSSVSTSNPSTVEVEDPSSQATPLLPTTTKTIADADADADVIELQRFRVSLKWCLLDHSTLPARLASCAAFLILGILVPALSALTVRDPPIGRFNNLVQLPSTALAAIAFLALPLLLSPSSAADSPHIRRRHAAELGRAFCRLALILLPSFFAELAHKLVLFSSVQISLPNAVLGAPASPVVFVLVLASWVYRSGIFLLVCVMFRLTCELQILRLEGFQKMFESDEDDVECGVMFKEHLRIRKQLWVTSHRYRFFIIGSLFIITVSQFGALLMILASNSDKNFLNSGDLVVCSAVEISGFCLCLVGAARITHRAQRIVSVATRWHMLLTCESIGPNQSKAHIQDQPNNQCSSESSDYSDNSAHNFNSVSPQHPSSFQTRQALVSYLEHNNAGITLFGFALDRGLLHTLFAFEFSLVLWILSKVVVL